MISVIVPVFNQAPYLKECIDSILDQDIQGEIIIVNDGSTDNSLEIAKKYQLDRPDVVKVIDQVNKGLASARNTGIMNAFYGWCLFLDADDKLAPGALEKIQTAIQKNPECSIISGSFKTFGTTDQEVILMKNPTLEDFKHGNRIGSSSTISRAALLAVGGFNPRMAEGFEDLACWINLLTRGYKIATIPEIVWYYRTKEESMLTKITPEIHKKLIGQINKDIPEANLAF